MSDFKMANGGEVVKEMKQVVAEDGNIKVGAVLRKNENRGNRCLKNVQFACLAYLFYSVLRHFKHPSFL